MLEIITKVDQQASKNVRWKRKEIAETITIYEQVRPEGISQRQLAEELSIPRTTLQHWLKRKAKLEGEKEVVNFFESPAGLVFLHELVIAAQFVMSQVGTCGIRLVCLFLELSGLGRFVASSYGAQQQVSIAMEKELAEFGQYERTRLATAMTSKQISVCQDETFHPEICLVGIEPVSNFMLVEKYAEARDESSWTKQMTTAVEGLAVEIIQSTSDEGKGLLAHVNNGLGVHHSPDLFHIQRELTKATAGSLASRTRKAKKQAEKAGEKFTESETQKTNYLAQGGGRNMVYFEQRQEKAQQVVQAAQQQLTRAESAQLNAQNSIRAISAAYHPFNLETGEACSPETLAALLAKHFSDIKQIAQAAELSEVSTKRIEKAHKLVPQMVATFTFFFHRVINHIQQQSLPAAIEEIVYQQLIPGFYLQQAASKAKSAPQRNMILATAETLLARATMPHSPLNLLEKARQTQILALAQECTQLFQRSSSCVEGRNGQLSLRHHSFHRLSNRKLNALTTVHNYFIKRDDGTTAAERFFGVPPADLFSWLLDHLDLPARPAKKRSLLPTAF